MTPADVSVQGSYELRFRPLSDTVQGYSFPCDSLGHVDLDTLSERSRNSYFYARVVIGHELAAPEVHRIPAQQASPLFATPVPREAGRDARSSARA